MPKKTQDDTYKGPAGLEMEYQRIRAELIARKQPLYREMPRVATSTLGKRKPSVKHTEAELARQCPTCHVAFQAGYMAQKFCSRSCSASSKGRVRNPQGRRTSAA